MGYVVTSYHGVSDAVHQTNITNLSALGYRPISLAVAGGLASPNYSAVWWQSAGPNWVTAHGMTESQYIAARLGWVLQGYRPKLVTASGSGTNTVWAAVFVQDGVTAWHDVNMSLAAFESDAQAKRSAGYRLVSCATYGSALAPRFAPVYELDDSVAWGWEADDNSVEFAEHIAAHSDGDNRPAFFGMRETSRYFSIWHDDRVGGWAFVGDRTSAQFANDKLAMQAAGLYPLSIAAGGSGANARFSGVFVERFTPYPRALTHSGPASLPLASFDQMMDSLVVDNRVRAATIAVIRNGRLVHTRGYGYAEQGYPQATPTSLFRIGSISKPLCGMVAHDLIEHGVGGLTLTSNMVNTLGIVTSNTYIASITLQQLMTHTSGLVNAFDQVQAATSANPPSPLPPDESFIVRHAVTEMTTPAGLWNYSNAGITAVGQMVEQASGMDYPVALQNRLLAPLGITRFGRQQGPKNQLLPGEVNYHLRHLYLRSGNLFADYRLLAPQYADRFWDSAGAGVTSAVDLARIIAGCFQIGADSPVFGTARQAAILNPNTFYVFNGQGTQARTTDGSWGWGQYSSGVYVYEHDGAQDGFKAYCMFRSDGIGVVTLFNSDGTGTLEADDLKPEIENALAAVTSWPTVDLFPNYGLPSFPRSPTLGSHLPNTVSNLGTTPIVFFGTNLDQVTAVQFDNVQLVQSLSTAWSHGYIDLVSPTVLHVYPPQGLAPGVHTVRAFSAVGGSNTVTVPFQLAPDYAVASQDYVIGGAMPFSVLVSKGPLSDLSWVALGFSESTLPSIAPGIVSLGIGNQFADLLTTDLVAFDATTGIARWNFPGLSGWSHADVQAIAIDFLAPAQFPLITSNVFTVDRL
ncbi:MAG: serine hydrolase [Planctomycetes bacterium]|nr:serine hydrolase [Planctomycetota bacterium]